MWSRRLHAVCLLTVLAACGKEKRVEPEPAPEPPPTETLAVSRAPMPIPPTPPPGPPGPLEVPQLGVTLTGPSNATITPDAPRFGDKESAGVVIESGTLAVHLWKSTVGAERDAARMTAVTIHGGTYTETTSEPTLVEYTAEIGGTKTYGYFVPIVGFTKQGEQLLCGTAAPVATPEALEPVRAVCATVAKK